ncbi:MAG: hypothetical protein Q4D29_06315 [Lachnospiraceae bacterium]|nr:hypothetical protein [Lachnospiraceae bacterium]
MWFTQRIFYNYKNYIKTEDDIFCINGWLSDESEEDLIGKDGGISVEIYTKGLKKYQEIY